MKKSSPYNDIDVAVAKFLKSVSTTFEVKFIREAMANKADDWKESADYFVCSFTTSKGVYKAFDYYTGVGLRINVRQGSSFYSPNHVVNDVELATVGIKAERGMYTAKAVRGLQGRTVNAKQWVVNPSAAGILYSLLSDMSALDTCFDDWCDNLGMDNDSLSALNLYQACCENGKKIRALFSNEQIEQLQELLQDY
jgi:hypothetical protein